MDERFQKSSVDARAAVKYTDATRDDVEK